MLPNVQEICDGTLHELPCFSFEALVRLLPKIRKIDGFSFHADHLAYPKIDEMNRIFSSLRLVEQPIEVVFNIYLDSEGEDPFPQAAFNLFRDFSDSPGKFGGKILIDFSENLGFAHDWEGDWKESMKGPVWDAHCVKKNKEHADILQSFIDYPAKVLFFEIDTSVDEDWPYEPFCRLVLNERCKETE